MLGRAIRVGQEKYRGSKNNACFLPSVGRSTYFWLLLADFHQLVIVSSGEMSLEMQLTVWVSVCLKSITTVEL